MDAEQTTPPTAPSLGRVTIKNFKSIKEVSFDTRRINLFVGRPNTGKSNILEALDIFGNAAIQLGHIRIDRIQNLFYDNDIKNEIKVSSSSYFDTGETVLYVYTNDKEASILFSGKGYPNSNNDFSGAGVRIYIQPELEKSGIIPTAGMTLQSEFSKARFFRYDDSKFLKTASYHSQKKFLTPPHGQNLSNLLLANKYCRDLVSSMLEPYGLYLLGRQNDTFLVVKILDGYLVEFPSWMLADTLKRQLFFQLAAISTNDAILLLEEPEAHSYPPYVKTLAQQISSSKSNQFFIATHSPYLLETLYENAEDDELQVFVVDYQNHQTVVHPVDNEALGELIDNRADVFFNLHNLVL